MTKIQTTSLDVPKHLKYRSVSRIKDSLETTEGGGFVVHRPFPTNSFLDFDPFLLLDEMGPKDYKPGEAKGAPSHPHRGFETVTYMLEGRFEHKDSRGNSGKLGKGDVQWMTAGAGVVHSEMPEKEFLRTGGRLHAFQLWINLPSVAKMINPRYQDVPSAKIPVVESKDGKIKVKVIAGEALGSRAVIDTQTPISYLHFSLQPGAKLVQSIPKEYNVFAYVINGEGLFGTPDKQHIAKKGQIVVFDTDGGEAVTVSTTTNTTTTTATTTTASSLDILLIGGIPLNEPVARYGPFVMNTKEEIIQAVDDYRNGKMGEINF
jgi:quercetin 2,3-dioxygenase